MIGLKYLYAMLAGAFSGQPALNLRSRRPTGSDLRDPADPVQAARIEAAAVKRARRAELRHVLASRSTLYNRAHHANVWEDVRPNLNPFYLAK